MEKNDTLEEFYLHGACYQMAIALHREFQAPLQVLTALRSKGDRQPHPAHVWILTDKGCMDVSGYRSEADILEEYLSGREQFTLKSARVETFATEEAFMSRMKVLFDNDRIWDEYKETLKKSVRKAEDVVRDYVIPRHVTQAEPQPA